MIATVDDYRVAHEIGRVVLYQSLREISPKAEELLEAIKLLKNETEEQDFSFTRKDLEDVKGVKGWGARQINRYLRELTMRGYCSIIESGKGKVTRYAMEGEPKVRVGLPTPEQLQTVIHNDPCVQVSNSGQVVENKEEKLDKGDLSNPVQPVQPEISLDNLGKPGQKGFVQLNQLNLKDFVRGRTVGQEGINTTTDLREIEL